MSFCQPCEYVIIRGRSFNYKLTAYQQRVMILVVMDYRPVEIALIINKKPKTVERVIECLMRQYNMHSKAALVYQLFKKRKL